MNRNTIKFTAVPYELNGKSGFRPQLEAQAGVYDLAFCEEVVKEKRLAMSADELLHGVEMLGEIAAKKVCEDGRPRGVTKLIKWNRYAKGTLESPTSPWNETCRAYVRAQLLADAVKTLDATFVNVDDGIGVRLNYVTYLGAKGAQNVILGSTGIGAYGNHMEFLDGDAAWLEYRGADGGARRVDLVCVKSDVAMAEFAAPAIPEDVEAGTPMTFMMKSRGGVADGQVYVSKKAVTYLGSGVTPIKPKVAFNSLALTFEEDGVAVGELYAAHVDAIVGHTMTGDVESFPVKGRLLGPGTPKDLTGACTGKDGEYEITLNGVSAGDVVGVTAEIDASREDIDPTAPYITTTIKVGG